MIRSVKLFGRDRLVGNTLWAVSGKFIGSLSLLVANGLLARALPANEYGTYALFFSYVIVFTAIAQIGLSQTIVRMIAKCLSQKDVSGARANAVTIMLLAFVSTAAVAIAHQLGLGKWISVHVFGINVVAGAILAVSAWIFFASLLGLLAEAFRGYHDIPMATVAKPLGPNLLIVSIIVAVIAVQPRISLEQVLAIMATGYAAVLLLCAIWFYRRKLASGAFSAAPLRPVFAIAAPLYLTGLMLLVLTQADVLIIGAFRTETDVALFGAAVRLVALVSMPTLIVNSVIAPVIVDMFAKGDTERLEELLRSAATITTLLVIPFVAVFVLLGDDVMRLVFGEFFYAAGPVLAILTIGQAFNAFAGSCGLALMMTGGEVAMMRITFLTGLLLLLCAVLVVGPFGIVGVAVVTAGAMFAQNVLMIANVKRRTGMWTHFAFALPKNVLSR